MSSHASTSRLPLPLSPHRPSRLDKGKRRAKVVIDLTLSDSSDSEPTPSDDSDDSEVEILPPKKRSRLPPPPTPTLAPVPRKPLGERTSHHNNNASSDDADAASRALAEQLAAEDAAAVSEERIAREEAASLALLEELAAEDERASRRREEDDLRGELAAQQEQEREAREWAAILDEKEKERDAVVFQVTMDSQGRTLEGDEDGDNLAHLAKVKQVFATGITQGLQIITVTYFVNHALNCRFEEAKQALLDAGRSVAEHTLFHGTTDQNVQSIIDASPPLAKWPVLPTSLSLQSSRSAYGPGVYLAQNPSTSLGYCKGGNRMSMGSLNVMMWGAMG
ncbi:hypothetical protein RQP46_003553 [Phenoliferia psychrophenolica]